MQQRGQENIVGEKLVGSVNDIYTRFKGEESCDI